MSQVSLEREGVRENERGKFMRSEGRVERIGIGEVKGMLRTYVGKWILTLFLTLNVVVMFCTVIFILQYICATL